ncbi:hypothetical protein RE474_08150 [Methanolobus sediminis]|uniref:Uncharacterized protein n=1 Tax=Methanolobus sediminis TaxID=3072978 RepID=A0AA51YI28_9EURY|nr:hypothetical protein [Methanolobus sediminis]WMW24070.1 hypothetical protein RE474_08150 [Methanolobus sediminis]
MKCPLCGKEFDEPDRSKCSGCGRFSSCNMQRCPGCGYEIAPETKLEKFIRGIFK